MLGNIVPGHPTGGVNKGARLRALVVLGLTAGSLLAKLTLFCPRPEWACVAPVLTHVHACSHTQV